MILILKRPIFGRLLRVTALRGAADFYRFVWEQSSDKTVTDRGIAHKQH